MHTIWKANRSVPIPSVSQPYTFAFNLYHITGSGMGSPLRNSHLWPEQHSETNPSTRNPSLITKSMHKQKYKHNRNVNLYYNYLCNAKRFLIFYVSLVSYVLLGLRCAPHCTVDRRSLSGPTCHERAYDLQRHMSPHGRVRSPSVWSCSTELIYGIS